MGLVVVVMGNSLQRDPYPIFNYVLCVKQNEISPWEFNTDLAWTWYFLDYDGAYYSEKAEWKNGNKGCVCNPLKRFAFGYEDFRDEHNEITLSIGDVEEGDVEEEPTYFNWADLSIDYGYNTDLNLNGWTIELTNVGNDDGGLTAEWTINKTADCENYGNTKVFISTNDLINIEDRETRKMLKKRYRRMEEEIVFITIRLPDSHDPR